MQRRRWTRKNAFVQEEIREIYKVLAEEFASMEEFKGEEISEELIRSVVESEFYFIKHCMASGVKGEHSTFPNVLLKYLGTFYASEGICHYKTENYKKKLKRKDVSSS